MGVATSREPRPGGRGLGPSQASRPHMLARPGSPPGNAAKTGRQLSPLTQSVSFDTFSKILDLATLPTLKLGLAPTERSQGQSR